MEAVPAAPSSEDSRSWSTSARCVGVGPSEPPPAAMLVGGDAGVGKSRLITELIRKASPARATRPALGTAWTLAIALCRTFRSPRSWAGSAPSRRLEAEAMVLRRPALRRLMPTIGSRAEENPQVTATDRSNLFEAVAAIFDHLGASRRLLWVVEDVHWADRSTREMITYLLSHPPANPATLILTYRLDDLHRRHPLRPVLAEWGRLPGVERITVPPLDESDVRGMVRALQRSPLQKATWPPLCPGPRATPSSSKSWSVRQRRDRTAPGRSVGSAAHPNRQPWRRQPAGWSRLRR